MPCGIAAFHSLPVSVLGTSRACKVCWATVSGPGRRGHPLAWPGLPWRWPVHNSCLAICPHQPSRALFWLRPLLRENPERSHVVTTPLLPGSLRELLAGLRTAQNLGEPSRA